MFKNDSKYGNIHINGASIDIGKSKTSDLNKYLNELETRRTQLIEEQNNYLSQIIK